MEHYYSLYSVAVLNEKDVIEGRKPLFVMYSPYEGLKSDFPSLDNLESVKRYYGKEFCTFDTDKNGCELDTKAFSLELVFKYFTKNYNELFEFLKIEQ